MVDIPGALPDHGYLRTVSAEFLLSQDYLQRLLDLCGERNDESIQLLASRREWIASRSLSSGAHSRDPLARNDGIKTAPHSDVIVRESGRSSIPEARGGIEK